MQRLSGLDATFLYMETPQMHMHVCFTVICDPSEMRGGFSFQKIADLIENRALHHPEFRRRLVEVPMRLDHPVWIDDSDFDIVHHVRHVALPGGDHESDAAKKRQLGEMIGRIAGSLLDRRFPLWEAWVIESLSGGRFALFVKFHHAVVDGVSGASLIQYFFDHSAKPPKLQPVTFPVGEPVPGDTELLAMALRERALRPGRFLRVLGKSAQAIAGVLRRSEQDEVEDTAAHAAHTQPYDAPRTHFNHHIGPRRGFSFARVSLPKIKELKEKAGVTVNDVVLAICGGALREYLLKLDDLPEKPLTAMVPVSVRDDNERGQANNRVSGMWSTLATDLKDPRARLARIHEDTKDAKDVLQAVGADLMQDWAEFNTPGAFNLAIRLYGEMGLTEVAPPVHNVVISNIPGPRQPYYFAGAKIDAIFPMGPVMEGVGLNITLLSYGDSIDFGFLVDRDLVPDVWKLADQIQPAFEALCKAYNDR